MTVPEPVPFQTERAKALEAQILPLSGIQPCLDASYLVRRWLGDGGLSVLFGPSNSGKTFIAVDLAMHVASGVAWRGHKVRAGPVIYIAAEGGGGIRNRICALKKAKPELTQGTDFYLLPTQLDLHGAGDAMALCEAVPVDSAALVVVDTMARSMGGGDENSARDVTQLIANLDAMRNGLGAHVCVIHHSGKNVDAGARGSSALRAAVDTEIVVSSRQITCVKQRDMEIPAQLFFGLETVDLGCDQDGDPVTSAIVVPADAPAKSAKPLTRRDEVAAQALTEAIRLQGQVRAGENFPNGRRSVELARWKEVFRKNGLTELDAKPDAQRKAFARARERLLDRDYIRIWGDFVWKVRADDQASNDRT